MLFLFNYTSALQIGKTNRTDGILSQLPLASKISQLFFPNMVKSKEDFYGKEKASFYYAGIGIFFYDFCRDLQERP